MKTILLSTLGFVLTVNLQAQTCADMQLKKGMVITSVSQMYQRDYAAMKVYLKLSKEDQQKADADFAKDVESGKITLPVNEITSTVEEVSNESGTTKYKMANLIRGKVYNTTIFCSNNILTHAPYQEVTQIKVPLPKGDTATSTTISGYNKFPLGMKVGDKLPAYQDMTNMSPIRYEYKGWVKHNETDINGDVWEISNLRTNHMDISSSTITKYVNREVLGEEDVVVNGVTYKTYKVITEIWTKSNTQLEDASALGAKLGFVVTKKLIDAKSHQAMGTNSEGYLVSSTVWWFSPALGVSLKTEIYDYKGNLFSKSYIKDIK